MAFTPNEVQINYTLNLDQVNLILSALGKLPYEQVGDMVSGIRAIALQTLQAAEAKAKAEAEAEQKQIADNAGKPSDVE